MMKPEDIDLVAEKMRNGMREMAEACSILKKQCDCSIFCPFALVCEFSLAPNTWPAEMQTRYDKF